MPKQSNWDILKSRDEQDTMKYRDVYGDQQLRRSRIDERQSPVSRIVLVCIAALLLGTVVYFLCCAGEFALAQVESMSGGGGLSPLSSSMSSTGDDSSLSSEDMLVFDPEDESTYSAATLEDWKALVGAESTFGADGAGWKFADGTTCGFSDIESKYEAWLAEYSAGNGQDVSDTDSESSAVSFDPVFNPDDPATYYLATMDEWKALVGAEATSGSDGAGWRFADGTTCGFTDLESKYDEWLQGTEKPAVVPGESTGNTSGAGEESNVAQDETANTGPGIMDYLAPSTWKLGISLLAALLLVSVLYPVAMRNLEAQNVMTDVVDINQWPNDQHIALPEEVQRAFDWFPDVGAHCPVQVSSMISHVALSNKGLKSVEVIERATKDEYDRNGNLLYYKGEPHLDENGNPIVKTVPIIDEKFMNALFDASGAPKSKKVRIKYDATKMEYNPGNENRDKIKDCDYVSDLINKTWTLPDYEPQRPAGAYLVDTAPVNSMV